MIDTSRNGRRQQRWEVRIDVSFREAETCGYARHLTNYAASEGIWQAADQSCISPRREPERLVESLRPEVGGADFQDNRDGVKWPCPTEEFERLPRDAATPRLGNDKEFIDVQDCPAVLVTPIRHEKRITASFSSLREDDHRAACWLVEKPLDRHAESLGINRRGRRIFHVQRPHHGQHAAGIVAASQGNEIQGEVRGDVGLRERRANAPAYCIPSTDLADAAAEGRAKSAVGWDKACFEAAGPPFKRRMKAEG